MAITGAPKAMEVGGVTSSGPAVGIYRTKISDAGTGESQKGRSYLKFDFIVDKDPEHAAKNGKKLTSKRFYGVGPDDDDEKRALMKGMIRRQVYQALETPWPKDKKGLDARMFVGKTPWVVIGPELNKETGEVYNTVVAMALDKKKLPKAALDGSLFKADKKVVASDTPKRTAEADEEAPVDETEEAASEETEEEAPRRGRR